MNKRLFLSLFFSAVCLSLCVSDFSNATLDNYLIAYENSLSQAKIISCLSVTQLSLSYGNNQLESALKLTKLGREEYYNKFILAMISKCLNTITQSQIDFLLTPENDNFETFGQDIKELISIEGMFDTVKLTKREQEIKDEIEGSIQLQKKSHKKEKEKELGFFEKYYMQVYAGALIIMSIFLSYGLRDACKVEKPKTSEEEKQIFKDMIEARGKRTVM